VIGREEVTVESAESAEDPEYGDASLRPLCLLSALSAVISSLPASFPGPLKSVKFQLLAGLSIRCEFGARLLTNCGATMNVQIEKRCPVCGSTYDSSLSYCTRDGQPLVAADPMIGELLDGKYRIESVVGRGGMGVVYKATHIHIDTEYAVKVLHPELVANQSAIERFRIEARAAGRIRHPNAIQVTDFGITPERFVYLVMEMVEGDSLRRLLETVNSFDLYRASHILSQACAAVEAAHQRGIIHRDLKPDNIIVTQKDGVDSVKVLDFGIAKLRDTSPLTTPLSAPLTQAGTLIGTPEYMSPEQCRGQQLDPRSDVYSLGIILYEMLSGELPFTGGNTLEIVIQQLNNPPRPLRLIDPRIPETVERVVTRALEKSPAGRQSSPLELSAEFNAAISTAAGEDPNKTLVDRLPEKLEVRKTRVAEAPVIARPSNEPPTPAPASLPANHIDDRATATAEKSGSLALAVGAGLLVALVGIGAYMVLRRRPPGPGPTPVVAPTTPVGMVLIPPGRFTMGPNNTLGPNGGEVEQDARSVDIKAFYIDQYEVTNEAYQKFVATERRSPTTWDNGKYAAGEERFPVTGVTWQDAADYARWVGKRLPREEEWEYVARGGDKGFLYPWGNDLINGHANVQPASSPSLVSVGSFNNDRSVFGNVFDLAGNVSEWVEDSLVYDTRLKVIRGGNIAENPPMTNTRRLYDFRDFPVNAKENDEYRKTTLRKVGFRCARDAVVR
jgi:serine/threonine protein kinase